MPDRPHALTRNVVLAVILFATFIALPITGLHLTLEYFRHKGIVQQEFADIEEAYGPSVARALWVANDELIETLLDGILRSRAIEFVAIREESDVVAMAGRKPESVLIHRDIELFHVYDGETRLLGSMRIEGGSTYVWSRLRGEAWHILGTSVLTTFLVAAFILLIIHLHVTRHLERIAAHLRSIQPGERFEALRLKRGARSSKDEIDVIRDEINDLTTRLHEAMRQMEAELELRQQVEQELRRTNAQIELRIAERTAELTATNDRLEQEIAQRRKVELDLRERETRLRQIAENVPGLVFQLVSNREGVDRFTFLSRMSSDILGLPVEEVMAEPSAFTDCIALGVREWFDMEIVQSARSLARLDIELPVVRPDGERRWLSLGMTPSPGRGGETIWNGVAVDVTAQKEVEERLRESGQELLAAKEAAELANRSKSEFLANMSHEIRTPLNGVLGMLQLLKLSELSEQQAFYTRTALDSGKSLLSIINDILDFSKVEAGRIDLHSEPFEVRKLVRSVLDMFGHQARQKGVETVVHVDERVARTYQGDQGRLRQVLFNLVGNAVKFTPAGRVSVEVYALPSRPGDTRPRLLFSVADTGIGIPEEKIGSIFEPFTQVDSSFTRTYQGTGLGLGIVRRLVQRMEGDIGVDSVVGEGTSVWFCVTLEAAETEQKQEGEHACSHESDSCRVLVVEDNAVNRVAALGFLEKLGHSAAVASNGQEAVDLTAQEPFDIILMDIQMPDMDGEEATRRIRANTKGATRIDVPIIAFTAHAMEDNRARFMAAGMNGFLPKPIDFDSLAAVLDEHLGIGRENR
jgi:PAS domain S-box-containing protein